MCIQKTLRPLIVALGLLLSVSALAGCATDRAIIDQANQFHGNLERAVITDPQLTNYLQSVGDRIITVAREMDRQHYGPERHRKEAADWMFSNEMRFHFVNSKTLNAFTTGGEHMYIYTELFQQCKTEDELAAVMAHEYAHIYGRHVHKGMDRQYMIMGTALGLGAAGYAAGGKEHGQEYAAMGAGLGMLAGNFIGMSFTRQDEAEADDMGFEFYVRAGWHPDRFDDFFQHMIDKGYDTTPAMMSDHPTLRSRVEIAQRRAKELPPSAREWRSTPVAAGKQFAALQARAREVGKHMPSDESLENAQELLQALPRSCLTPTIPDDQKQAEASIAKKIQAQQEAQRQAELRAQQQSQLQQQPAEPQSTDQPKQQQKKKRKRNREATTTEGT